jgi:diguanylate cyclase (GGDEF)-like protein
MGSAAAWLATPPADNPDRGVAQLRSLVAMAALLGDQRPLNEVIEVAAEAARAALGAASVSISRWEPQHNVLRTMVNVGHLGPDEERFPADEVCPGKQWWFAGAEAAEVAGRIHFATLDGDDPVSVDLLRSVAKESAIAVPIVVEGATWGELWATTARAQPRFQRHDAEFMLAIAAHIAAGIASATWRERLAVLAYTDPLTGLANRRAFNEQLEGLMVEGAASRHLVLLVCDVDDLKGINDGLGHTTGDEAIVRVAHALQAAVATMPSALAGRIGGDEFCVLLDSHDVDVARAVAEQANRTLAEMDGPHVSLSCGIASSAGVTRMPELFHLADTAQFTAKRAGPGNVCVAGEPGVPSAAAYPRHDRQRRRLRGSRVVGSNVIADVLGLLDDTRGVAEPDDRLVAVAMRLADTLDATGWAVSLVRPDLDEIRTVRTMDTERAPVLGLPDQRWTSQPGTYRLSDYPRTAEVVTAGAVAVQYADGPEADPLEVALLNELGSCAVLITASSSAAVGTYLLELYADARTADLDDAAPWVRLLVAEAVRGARAGAPR